jgi:lysophospholipase L1-like esterase
MYSWKAIRTFCAVLILIPVVHLAFLVSRDTLSVLDASPDAWARELEVYVKQDMRKTLPESPVVVVGGRRVKLWRSLDTVLAPQPVLMRGLGDATLDDIAEEFVSAARNLARIDRDHGITQHFVLISPLKTPLFPQDHDKIDRITRELSLWASSREWFTLVDANRMLSRGNGKAGPEFFRSDGVHLNESGYLRLAMQVQEQLDGQYH